LFKILEKDLTRLSEFEEFPNESVIPYLVFAYGLIEIYPYVVKKHIFLDGARDWLRLRGTKKALGLAISWLGFDAEIIEREPGVNFYRFALALDRKPSDGELRILVKVCELSSPVRSRLTKIFVKGGYVGKFVLSSGVLGKNILSDDGGVLWRLG
jgi:hypothetical protein